MTVSQKMTSLGASTGSTFLAVVGTTARVFGALMIISGLLIALGQVFSYMQNGTWTQVPVLFLSDFLPSSFQTWLDHPRSWPGLHKIVLLVFKSVPASVFLILLGVITWWVGRGMRGQKN